MVPRPRLHFRWILPGLIVLLIGTSGCAREPTRTEILWDTWGVPHIYAPSADSLFFAHGWAQMHAHGDRILRLYGEARGRAAEYWGADHLASDRRIHTLGLPERSAQWTDAQDEPFRGYIASFVAGMNAYAETHPDRLNDERERVLPIKPSDVFAHILRTIHVSFVARRAFRSVEQWRGAPGSNGWAVAPSRSARGNALLLANPHAFWGDLFTWFEAQLTGPGVDAYGASFIGTPLPAFAFNDYLGWTHTVNPMDGADLYKLTVTGDSYAWNGSARAFDSETKTLRVRLADGTLGVDTLVVQRSVHGPIIARRGDEALAVRIVGLQASAVTEQYWRMLQATSLTEFEEHLQMLQMPMFNTIYADGEGNIMYHFGGHTPVRPRGDWAYWQGVVPGDTSATLWTEIHPYGDLPRIVNPPSGWVQNANEPPFTATLPRAIDTAGVPDYMTPLAPGPGSRFRSQRSIQMLASDSSITFDELVGYKNDARMAAADRLLDDLISAVQQHGSSRAQQAIEVLEAWDRTADAESQGAVLFAAWMERMLAADNLFDQPYRLEAPRSTPDGLVNPETATQALAQAAEQVLAQYDSLTVPWGAVHRLVGPNVSYPASGGPGHYGLFRALYFGPPNDQGRRPVVAGDSYIALVEFTSDGPHARVLLTYGNASQPGSPHRGDQLSLYAEKEMRPAWRSRDSIMAHLDRRTTFE